PQRFVNTINENICRDGRRVWMAWTNKPILDEQARVVETLAVGTDITERVQAEEALRNLKEMTANRMSAVEKQVSIGRLAAGVAHEINNPLTAILSLSMLMQQNTPDDDEKREDLDIIVTETKRCREIVRSLLDFARESPAHRTVVDINQIARETVLLASKYDAMDRAEVIMDLSPTPLHVYADSKMIQQVLTNLLLNAAEALDTAGTIRMKIEKDSSGDFVHVHVTDTGKGIPKEDFDRIFEPFFTTKGPGRGTGLGLSVSFGIMQKHDGTIEIHSEEGVGTTVTIVLPKVSEP
ncbi:MAG TPA: ATP-binding protein, partial [Thermodesulfobacteriota bacterium]|nr:ATP-binding protein [Thermodesulfobacteriota bacterium]